MSWPPPTAMAKDGVGIMEPILSTGLASHHGPRNERIPARGPGRGGCRVVVQRRVLCVDRRASPRCRPAIRAERGGAEAFHQAWGWARYVAQLGAARGEQRGRRGGAVPAPPQAPGGRGPGRTSARCRTGRRCRPGACAGQRSSRDPAPRGPGAEKKARSLVRSGPDNSAPLRRRCKRDATMVGASDASRKRRPSTPAALTPAARRTGRSAGRPRPRRRRSARAARPTRS